MDVNEVGEKASCGPILLSKLNVINNGQCVEYITKTLGDNFARFNACKTFETHMQ